MGARAATPSADPPMPPCPNSPPGIDLWRLPPPHPGPSEVRAPSSPSVSVHRTLRVQQSMGGCQGGDRVPPIAPLRVDWIGGRDPHLPPVPPSELRFMPCVQREEYLPLTLILAACPDGGRGYCEWGPVWQLQELILRCPHTPIFPVLLHGGYRPHTPAPIGGTLLHLQAYRSIVHHGSNNQWGVVRGEIESPP